MKKISTLFVRNEATKLVTPQVTPDCMWVIQGEGLATRKHNGMCCKIENGCFYKRREVKWHQTATADFVLAELDENTGNQFGWVPVTNSKEDAFFREAIGHNLIIRNDGRLFKEVTINLDATEIPEGFRVIKAEGSKLSGLVPECHFKDGTYELVGPKVQGNPEKSKNHRLIRHGSEPLPNNIRTFDELKEFFTTFEGEGIVWHHKDGRMVKIKKRDFFKQESLRRVA